jgi:hypothetical protein
MPSLFTVHSYSQTTALGSSEKHLPKNNYKSFGPSLEITWKISILNQRGKSSASELDVADRQNAHSQTILLLGPFKLFQLVGREKELVTSINGFSFSYNDMEVRIWGHFLIVDENEPKFYRELIARFNLMKIAQADNRWVAWIVNMNILDLWAEDHLSLICSAVDMLPADLDLGLSKLSEVQPGGGE